MPDNQTRNLVIFAVCAILIFIVYDRFVIQPQARQARLEAEKQMTAQAMAPASAARPAPVAVTREQAVAGTPRIAVKTPSLTGSVSLRGGRIDDLFLTKYKTTLEDPRPVELLRPDGVQYGYFAEIGWTGQNIAGLPGPDAVWTAPGGATLTPGTPVTLSYDAGTGLRFQRTISVDADYLFSITDVVVNATPAPVTIAPYGSVQRQGIPPELTKQGVGYQGAIGILDGKLERIKYPKWAKEDQPSQFQTTGGWLGVTDTYWLTALIPDQGRGVTATYRTLPAGGAQIYEAAFAGEPLTIPAGSQATTTTHVFAGAKRVPVLQAYSKQLGAPRLDDAVDWGWFHFLTQPLFFVLNFFFQQIGNFGLAILCMTVLVRLAVFPLANKSYESMTKMKKLAPRMQELKEKYGKDPQQMQKETLAMYQREKVNPLSGCLPLLIQIPIFIALYQMLSVTIEMRHAPFFGWIQDLSARDPTTFINLFGLIPWDPATTPLIGPSILDGFLHVGVWPLLYGFTMWLTTAMNPPAPDPMQQRIFQLMPILFTFMFGNFAVGLVIYWTWSNCLSIIQQYVIMRRFKVDNPIDQFLRKVRGVGAAKDVG